MKRKQEAAHDEKIVKISSFPALATFSLGGGRERGRCDVRQSRHGTPHTDRQTHGTLTLTSTLEQKGNFLWHPINFPVVLPSLRSLSA